MDTPTGHRERGCWGGGPAQLPGFCAQRHQPKQGRRDRDVGRREVCVAVAGPITRRSSNSLLPLSKPKAESTRVALNLDDHKRDEATLRSTCSELSQNSCRRLVPCRPTGVPVGAHEQRAAQVIFLKTTDATQN